MSETIKVKWLNIDSAETFNFLCKEEILIFFQSQKMLTIRDGEIYNKLCQLDKCRETISKLTGENEELKKKQIVMSALSIEKDKLKEQLENITPSSEYQGEIDKYKAELDKIKLQEGKQLSQIQELSNKIKSLEKNNQSLKKDNQALQGEKQKLETTNKQLKHVTEKKEDIKTFFSKWGSYKSLMKDIKIIQFFMSRPNQELRQKIIIETFKNSMDKSTCRNHLYRLVQKGILKETGFKGSYRLNPDGFRGMAVDIDEIASLILGRELYEMAVNQHKRKNERSEY